MKVSEAAYIAGFVDGEGCLSLQKTRNSLAPRLSIIQKYPGPLLWIRERTGGMLTQQPSREGAWTLHIGGQKLLDVLQYIEPYLILKQEQARLIMQLELRPGIRQTSEERQFRSEIHRRLQQLKVQ